MYVAITLHYHFLKQQKFAKSLQTGFCLARCAALLIACSLQCCGSYPSGNASLAVHIPLSDTEVLIVVTGSLLPEGHTCRCQACMLFRSFLDSSAINGFVILTHCCCYIIDRLLKGSSRKCPQGVKGFTCLGKLTFQRIISLATLHFSVMHQRQFLVK